MTCSRSNSNTLRANAGRSLLALALCGAAGLAAAQDGGARYAQALADANITQRYNTQLQTQIRSQADEVASLEQQLAGLDQTAGEVQPMLQRMFDDLEKFVAADLPFRQAERETRMTRLRDLMGNPETTSAEKYRKLLEAYQIEMEYGRTMDAYSQEIDGKPADLVRLGRISLMYKAQDGKTGYWDNQKKAWVENLDDASGINEALRIAKGEGAPDLITVPVPTAPGGGS
ncbi:MAG TPA: DUF3450 domain-containing protein [Gammaproteobacteria bacterium]|nr:DUF3450 domain-containing protein [Gammaproteobacteria bacterium]